MSSGRPRVAARAPVRAGPTGPGGSEAYAEDEWHHDAPHAGPATTHAVRQVRHAGLAEHADAADAPPHAAPAD